MNINEALNILNLSGEVTKEDITKAYKKLAIKYHPDRNDSGAEIMKNINSAYDTLKSINAEDLQPLRNTKISLSKIVDSAYTFLNSLDLDVIKHSDDKNAYDYSKKLESAIFNIFKINNITLEVCGNWVWLSGDTKINKDKIKSLGYKWSKHKKMWYYRPDEHKCRKLTNKELNMQEIRNKYGSSILNSKSINNNVYMLEAPN